MTYEKFEKILNAIRNIDAFIDKAGEMGVDLFETDLYDGILTLEGELFINEYTKEGYEWVSWYLYELPHFKKKIEEEGDKKEYHAWDADGEPMDFETDRDLWLMLEKDYVNGED